MATQQEVRVNVSLLDTLGDSVLRFGAAAPIELPEPLKITGTIAAPRLFVEKRRALIDKDKCHVTVNRQKGIITLVIDEQNTRGAVIVGKMKGNEDLIAFGINTEKKFGLKELTGFLRMRRMFFPDKEQHGVIIQNLSTFVARVETEIKSQDNRKGHTLAMIEKKVTHEIPLDFKLCIPIFESLIDTCDPTFTVEILADVTDGGVSFWLESVELEELREHQRSSALESEEKALADYVIIYE